MTKMSQGNKKIKARKVPATKKGFLIRTGSLIQPVLFLKKYRQPIIKFWPIPVAVHETVLISVHNLVPGAIHV